MTLRCVESASLDRAARLRASTNCIILSLSSCYRRPVHASQRNVGSAEDQRRALRSLPPGAEGPLPAPAQTAVPVGLLLSQKEE